MKKPKADGGLNLNLGGRPRIERAIAGALKDCIHNHGPITSYWTGSAAKRVYKQLGVLARMQRDEARRDSP